MKLKIALAGVGLAALVAAAPAAAFTPSNPYYAKQWYLAQDHAFDAWDAPPTLAPVKVAIVDSGLDCSLPDFQNRIAATRSFVGGNACTDAEGHGTVVAGEIAGNLDGSGVVGLAYSSQLLVAKVVAPDGTIPLGAEASAIRWAANQGAQVINLSFGAVRDPRNRNLDTYSKREARAVAYAYGKGALVVAAVGNADEAYATPWPYASWPSALPHVIGVGALTRSGNVPDFSDRDPVYVDLAAPGVDIFSTFPAALTAAQPSCAPQGYTDCALGDYQHPDGTSFAAPQVAGAAAILFGLDPTLTNSQVGTLLERSVDDVNASTGCAECVNGRDRFSGWGSLDVAKAVAAVQAGTLPHPDRLEPNDTLSQARKLWGRRPHVNATLDYWDDRVDVYRVKLARGQLLDARVRAKWRRARVRLVLLRGTSTVVRSRHAGPSPHLAYRARKAGWYYVELRVSRHGGGSYALELAKLTSNAA